MSASGQEDIRSLERKIGEVVGVLSPIPNQLGRLFERLDTESQERLSGDANVKSDVRSITQSVEQLTKSLQSLQTEVSNLKLSVGAVKCAEHTETINNMNKTLDDIKFKVKDLARLLELRDGNSPVTESVADLKRIFKLEDGDSKWANSVNEALENLEDQMENINKGGKSLWNFTKYIGGHIITIIITLIIAYLLVTLGFK